MTRPVISVTNLGKSYPRDLGTRPNTLKARVLARGGKKLRGSYWALRGISFEVLPGQAVGVIGLNGAGKSTLLRLLGGVGKPSEGSVSVYGRIGALLEIGAGLTDDLTGLENIFLLGTIAGLSRREIKVKLEEIVEFSELSKVIYNPVRAYSTGMRMRLAFAVAIHCDPDVLLVDEALAVGDANFQGKCLSKVAAMRRNGTAIFLVSHDWQQIEGLCDHALYLRDGTAVAFGRADEVLEVYRADFEPQASKNAGGGPMEPEPLIDEINRFRSGRLDIARVAVVGADRTPFTVKSRDRLDITLSVANSGSPIAVAASIAVHTLGGMAATEAVTTDTMLIVTGNSAIELSFPAFDLVPGSYRITVGLYEPDWSEPFDLHVKAYPLAVSGEARAKGVWNADYRWNIRG